MFIQILSASADKTVMKWDYTEGIQLNTFPCKYPFVALHTSPHTSLVLAVRQLANQGELLALYQILWYLDSYSTKTPLLVERWVHLKGQILDDSGDARYSNGILMQIHR